MELTYNWDGRDYEAGTAFGHLAVEVDDVHVAAEALAKAGVPVTRAPGPLKGDPGQIIAFVADPDGYAIELIERRVRGAARDAAPENRVNPFDGVWVDVASCRCDGVRMFFLGHSHVVALEKGAELAASPYRSLNLWGFGRPVIYGEGPPRLDDTLRAMLDGHELVVSAVGGSAHDMLGLAQHARAFDFVLPDEPDLALTPGAQIVSHAAVDAAIRSLMEPEQLDLVRLLAQPGRRVVHIESPPAIGDDPRLSAQLADMPFVPADHRGPSSRWLRYKLWRVHSALVREACAAAGVVFAPAPAAALTEGRFLRPDLYERPCHANAAYGALVLRDLGLTA